MLVIGAGLVFASVLLRVGWLQQGASDRLAAMAGSRHGVAATVPVRGSLYDRRGRVLAATRFAHRVFVDPTRLPADPSETIVGLAEALGLDPSEVGATIAAGMTANELERDRAAKEGDEPRLRRYTPIAGPIDEGLVDRVRSLGLAGVHVEDMALREYPALQQVGSVVGKVGSEHTGLLGVELALDDRLRGSPGTGRYVRDASRRPLWIEPGSWRAAERGVDVRVSLDLEIQRIAAEELQRGMLEADAAGGRVMIADPRTGEVLAVIDLIDSSKDVEPYPWWPVDRPAQGPVEVPPARYDTLSSVRGEAREPALHRSRCIEDLYEPGSSFKPFVWAMVTEAGLARPDEVFDTENGRWNTPYGRSIEDVTKRDVMTWMQVLENSSNIGMIKAADRMSFEALRQGVLSLGFGVPTGVGLAGESAGMVTGARAWSKYTQTSVAFGHEVAVTPAQMLRAFMVFCRTGEFAGTMPDLRLAATDAEGVGVWRRIFRAETTELVRRVLREVAAKVEVKMEAAGETGWRYSMFGKSGTADVPLGPPPPGMRRPPGAKGYYPEQYNSSFVAAGPVGDPRVALVVVIDDPGPELVRNRLHYGSSVAGPVARRILERSLGYLRVEPDLHQEPAAVLAEAGSE
jgi:cell division protein FtsI (penicillin-binding protein 3)